MTDLFMWEYEGKTEFGYKYEARFLTLMDPYLSKWRNEVTNLRPAKVVDEDAVQEITSADGLWVHDGKEWRTRYAMWRGKPLKTKEDWDNYYLAINPPVTKTYLTTEQFITVWNSLDDEKRKELHAAWNAAWDAAWYATRNAAWYATRNAAWDADLAVLVKDKISDEHFEILTKPWTSCGLSLFVEADTRSDGDEK